MLLMVTYRKNEIKKQRVFKSRAAFDRWEHEQENDVQILTIKEVDNE